MVSGVWRPRDLADPFWRLTPDVTSGVVPGSATYGPLVVDRRRLHEPLRFATRRGPGWPRSTSTAPGPQPYARSPQPSAPSGTCFPKRPGSAPPRSVESGIDALADAAPPRGPRGQVRAGHPDAADRAPQRAGAGAGRGPARRSRRPDSALLRAVVPAPLSSPGWPRGEPRHWCCPPRCWRPRPPPQRCTWRARTGISVCIRRGWHAAGRRLWLVAGLAALGCVAAMTVPVLRRGTYTRMAAQSRRSPAAPLRGRPRAVRLALLGWLQLRQYASAAVLRRAAALGIDPLLAAAPTLGILAGAVLALRLLAPATRLAERLLGPRAGFGAVLGMWQAEPPPARRPGVPAGSRGRRGHGRLVPGSHRGPFRHRPGRPRSSARTCGWRRSPGLRPTAARAARRAARRHRTVLPAGGRPSGAPPMTSRPRWSRWTPPRPGGTPRPQRPLRRRRRRARHGPDRGPQHPAPVDAARREGG